MRGEGSKGHGRQESDRTAEAVVGTQAPQGPAQIRRGDRLVKFVHARSESVVRRYVNIIDGPEIPHPDSSVQGKKILLTKVEIHYILSAGSWLVAGGTSPSIYAEGWILKGDGTRSQRQWKGRIVTAPVRTENGWLKKLIDGARPTGKSRLPFDVTEA